MSVGIYGMDVCPVSRVVDTWWLIADKLHAMCGVSDEH